MALVLTASSIVKCASNGPVSTSGNSKLKIAGNAVLLSSGVAGKSVTCPATPAETKCTTVGPVTAGVATKLKISGQGVLLDSLSATATPNGHSVSASAGQSKLKAV